MTDIAQSILAINANAKFTVFAEDASTVVWLESTTPIAEAAILAKQTQLINAEPMVELRKQRNIKLSESDYMGNSDVTLSDAWKTYRQALRDITSQTPSDTTLGNINWPTKPS